MRLSDFQALVPYTTIKSFIRVLLNPNTTRRLTGLTAEQALSYTWPTSFAAPTEHDLCDLRKKFDLRSCWHSATVAARTCRGSRKVHGSNNDKKDQLVQP